MLIFVVRINYITSTRKIGFASGVVFIDHRVLAAFAGKIVYSVLDLIIKSPFLDLKLGNKVIRNLESNLVKG